jgi:transcriptional regulator with XRE-family HTH domain
MKRFGEKLRSLRQRQGLTLRQLGAQLEVSNTFVLSLEQGKKTPNAATILKIADLFNMSLDQLMRDELELNSET